MKKRKNLSFKIFLGILGILFLVVIAATVTYVAPLINFPKPFDPVVWQDHYARYQVAWEEEDVIAAYGELQGRVGMAKTLASKGILTGKTKDEVITLIGLEDNDLEDQSWSYWIDFTTSDNRWLEVEFDEDDKVIRTYLRED